MKIKGKTCQIYTLSGSVEIAEPRYNYFYVIRHASDLDIKLNHI